MDRIGWLTHDHFAVRRGEQFGVTVADRPPVDLELIETTEGTEPGGRGPGGEQRMQFSLIFRGPLEPALSQGTYLLSNAQLGEFDLFIVPIGPDAEGMRYEAVFA